MRYRWNDFVSNGRLLREDDSTFITRMSVNANSVYTDMWHATQKATLLIGLSLSQSIPSGGDQGNAHFVRDLGKSTDPARTYLK